MTNVLLPLVLTIVFTHCSSSYQLVQMKAYPTCELVEQKTPNGINPLVLRQFGSAGMSSAWNACIHEVKEESLVLSYVISCTGNVKIWKEKAEIPRGQSMVISTGKCGNWFKIDTTNSSKIGLGLVDKPGPNDKKMESSAGEKNSN